MDFGGVSRDVAGRHSMSSSTSNETAPYSRGEDDEPIYNDYRAMRLAAIPLKESYGRRDATRAGISRDTGPHQGQL